MESADTALVAKTSPADEEVPQALQTELQVGLVETRERLGIPDPDALAPLEASSPGAAELEYLKQMLREREQARLDALQSAADMQMQLANAQAETAKSKKQYYGVPKSRETLTRVEADLAETRTQLHAVKKELEWEQRAHRADAIQASARVTSLEKELIEAKTASAESRAKNRHGPLRIVLGAAAAIVLAAGIAAISMRSQNPVSVSDASSRAQHESATARDPVTDLTAWQSKSTVLNRHSVPPAAADFTQSFDRLSQALASLPGRTAEDVFRQVRKAGKGCALSWNDGEPSLLFGREGGQGAGNAGKSLSLGAELTQCAEAIEKMH